MSKKPLKATDRRRNKRGAKAPDSSEENTSGHPLANLFNDRRRANGAAKRSF